MRPRLLSLVLALAAAVTGDARAATPLWTETFVAEPGTMTVVSGSKSGTVVAVVGGGTLVASTDHGVTWLPVNPVAGPPTGGSSQTRVAVATPNRWYAENGHVVSLSTDRGTSWQPLTVQRVVKDPRESFEYAEEVAAADGTATALVGWGGARIKGGCPYSLTFLPVFTTHDAGRSWRRSDLPVGGSVWSAQWLDSRRAAVVVTEFDWSDPERAGSECTAVGTFKATSVWTTNDGGAHWRRAARSTQWWFASAAWTSPDTLVVIGEHNGVGRSYVSSDGGRTFGKPLLVYATGVEQQRLNGFPALDFVDARRGWVGTIMTGVYRTDDGGTEWTHEMSPADGAAYGVPDLVALDRDRAVMAGPRALVTRHGDAPVDVARFAGPVRPLAPESIVSGGARYDLTRPAYGPAHVTLSVTG